MKMWKREKEMFKLIILLILLSPHLFSDNKTIVFAPLPMKDMKTIDSQFSPMIRYLEDKLNSKIKLDYNTSYEQILKKFIDGKIDIAYLCPLPYLSLESKYKDLVPLVNFKNKSGNTSFTCSLVSFITNDYPKKGMKNTKIALTQALSTCGYLFVNDILNKSNIDIEENKYKYLGEHDKVASNVILGKFKYAGLKTNIAEEYYHLGLKEISRSEPIPSFILVANAKTLEKKMIDKIKQSMILINKNEISLWHKNLKYGTKETNIDDYAHLRRIIKSTKIPLKSNF